MSCPPALLPGQRESSTRKHKYCFSEIGAQPISTFKLTELPTRANQRPQPLTIVVSTPTSGDVSKWESKEINSLQAETTPIRQEVTTLLKTAQLIHKRLDNIKDCLEKTNNELDITKGHGHNTQDVSPKDDEPQQSSLERPNKRSDRWELAYKPPPKLTQELSVLDEESPADATVRLGQEGEVWGKKEHDASKQHSQALNWVAQGKEACDMAIWNNVLRQEIDQVEHDLLIHSCEYVLLLF